MRINGKGSKSSLFLFELIFVVLFFSVASVVCIQLFVHSYFLSENSTNLTKASLNATTVAETFKAYNGDVSLMITSLKGVSEGKNIAIYYDKDWIRVTKNQGYRYKLIANIIDGQQIMTANIKITDDDKKDKNEIYDLTVKKAKIG